MTSEEFFNIIKDGEWHSLNNLATQLELPIEKLTKFARSLHKQGIIGYQEEKMRIKLDPEWKTLFLDETFT